MKKGQILEGIVERVDFPNKGVVKVREENGEEAVCIVKNVLPGQKISFCVQIHQKKQRSFLKYDKSSSI